MKKTAKPVIAGILNIVAGGLGGGLGVFWGITDALGWGSATVPIPGFIAVIYLVVAIVYLLVAVLVLVGGIFALRRKHWGWVLAGSIAASFIYIYYFIPVSLPLGIASAVLIAQSKGEFE